MKYPDEKIQSYNFEPLGFLKSCFIDRFGTPRQPHLVPHSRASLQLRADLNPVAITDSLQQFSHVWLIWVFHQNTNKMVRPKIHPPRLEGKTVGLFASRSPHRPNPIGLSLVKLNSIQGDTIHLSEIDLIDGTPILDIKPYVRECDSRADANDGWTSDVPWTKWAVDFQNEPQDFLKQNAKRIPAPVDELTQLIVEVLSQDPRPLVYKGDSEDPAPYREDYFIYLYNLNIRFRFKQNIVSVEQIEFRAE